MASRRRPLGTSRTPSSYAELPLKRALSAGPGQIAQRRRVNVDSRPPSATSYQSTAHRTPAGTPIPIQPRSNNQHEPIEEEESDVLEHRIVAIDRLGKNTIGCSYYVAREGVLFCMEDIEDADNEIINALKLDIEPTTLLVSPRIEMPDDDGARSNSVELSDNEEPVLPYKVELRPSNDFKYEQAVQKLAGTPSLGDSIGVRFLVPGEEEQYHIEEMGLTDERGRALHISSSINLDSRVSTGCAGAVVTYLQRMKASEYLHNDPDADAAYRITRLEVFSLKNTMLVNQDTLAALQILQPESHPNAAKQGPGSSGSKESLSMYGLFYLFAKSPQGRQQLRHMFLRPSKDLESIQTRHNSVAVFAKAENQDPLQKLSKSMTKIKNMTRIMALLHKGIEGGTSNSGSIKFGVWSSLLDFCFHIIDISETLNEVTGIQQVPIYRSTCTAFDRGEFQRLGKIMWDVVDLEESRQQLRTVVKRGINQDLDQVKDAYDSMDEILEQTAIETVRDLPVEMPVPKLTVVYIPQLGFHVTMPTDEAVMLMTYEINPDWERTFTTDAGSYFKNNKMRTMDRELGDLWAQICDTEIEISHELAQRVLEKELFLVIASDLCGQLDALLALAHGASEYKLVRPRMVEDNVIDIRGGRHLIQELTVPAYVPNDTFLVGGSGTDDENVEDRSSTPPDQPSLLLLTGPNYFGKSVYLKQVALIVYMAQVGSFVPAEYARLGVTDKILTRVTARETVSKGQSSFMIDIQQIAFALKAFTPRTLLIIDEFGKGTDSCDGAGLAAGVFTYLLNLHERAPKVLASTHFHEIFDQNIMSESAPGLGLRQMEVRVRMKTKAEQRTADHNSEVIYLYNVRPGRSKLSYGAQCAAMNGIPDAIVERACELTELAMAGEDLVAKCSQAISPEEAADLADAEAVSRAFLSMDLDNLSEEQVENFKDILGELLASGSSACTTTTSHVEELQTPS